MSSSALILNSIEFLEKNVYKITFLKTGGMKLVSTVRITKFNLDEENQIKGINFDSEEIGKISAKKFVDLKSINSAIFAFHDAQKNRSQN